MKLLMAAIFLLILSTNSYSKSVEIIVKAPFNTAEQDELFLTGNIKELCNWEVKCQKLEKIFPHTFRKLIEVSETVSQFDFKVTRGSWNTQAAASSGRIYPDRKIELNEENEPILLTIANWSDKKPHGITGQILKLENFKATPLKGKKNIWIWLPPSYDKSSAKNYPVLYMHDGQNVFDPLTSGFGNEWSVDEVMTNLISKRKIKEAIVVAASSSPDNRNGEYTYDRDGHAYASFIIENLKPYIDKNYRTLSDRSNTYLMGSSMGALISFTILWKHSSIFSKAASVSLPAFAHKDRLFKWMRNQVLPDNEIKLYMDHGTSGGDKKYLEPALRFLKVLEKKGMSKSRIEYQIIPYADHTELDWARRVENPLLYLLSI